MSKTCISTYSFHGATWNGRMTFRQVADKVKELGCSGIEFVINDTAPDGSDFRPFWTDLAEYARSIGLEIPIYTTGANFFQKDPSAEIERVKKHVDLASELGIPLMRLKKKDQLLIACINRNGKILFPRGQDTIEAGDGMIVITKHTGFGDASDILL